jgi:hypothetical protein
VMTTNIEDHAREAEPSPRAGERIRRAMLWPIDFCRANRRAVDDQLSINGKAARCTVFDRAHFDRHRREVAAAENALNLARTEQAKPYSLASEVARMTKEKIDSGLSLLGRAALALTGAGLSIFAAIEARQPDSVLMQHATQVHQAPPPPSASDQRDLLLWLISVGVVLLIGGLYGVMKWARPTPAK